MTGKSETRDKAFVRYTMTTTFLQRLHDEKPWEKNSAVQTINGYHSNAANLTSKMSQTEMKHASETVLENQIKELKPLDYILLENLGEIRETHFTNTKFTIYEKYTSAQIIFSQFSMAMVQSAFFGSMLLFPEIYGTLGVPE